MRMNYRKRLWPMLALLPVFALAAALSIGLLGTNPPPANAQAVPAVTATPLPAVGAGKCGIQIPDTTADGWGFGLVTANTLAGGGCITSGDSVMVEVTNLDTDTSGDTPEAPALLVAYVTGGDDIPTAQAGGAASPLGKLGLNEHRFALAVPTTDQFSGATVNAKATIPVTRSMAKDGDVYVFLYNAASTSEIPISRTATPPVLPPTNGYIKAIKVEFTGDAAAKLADETTNASTLTVRGVGYDEDAAAADNDSPLSTSTGQREVQVTSDGEATVTLNLRDVNNKPVGAQATFTIGGAANIDFAGSNLKTSVRTVPAAGTITETIRNLPATGALRIPLTATVGDLELTYNIIRTGPEAATLGVTAYACTVVLDAATGEPADTSDDEAEDYCVDEKEDLGDTNTANDPDPLTVVAPGDHFLLAGNARDSVGNLSQADAFTLRWSAGDDTAAVLANTSTENVEFDPPGAAAMVDDLDMAVVRVASTASLGNYSLTVADKGGDVPTDGRATVNFIVSGGPDPEDGYSISGADNIPLGRYEEYTVRVLDANDNQPNLDDTNRCIGIRVRGVGFNSEQDLISRVETSGPCDGLTRLDNAGQASFTIEAPLGITAGTTASIQIRAYGRIVADKTITFGTAPLTLGNPAGLSVSSDAAGEATVTWTPATNATIHWVWRVKPDGMGGMWHRAAGDAGTLTIEGLDSGASYYFIAIAGLTQNDMTTWSQWTNWSALTEIAE